MNIFNKIIIHTQPSAAREKIKQGSERARAALKIWVLPPPPSFLSFISLSSERETHEAATRAPSTPPAPAIISRAARIYCKKATQKGLYGEKRNKERIINGAAVINFIVPPL